MRIELVIPGLVLLLVGLVGTSWGLVTSNSAQTASNAFCPSGSLPPEICATLNSTATTYRTLAIISAVVGVGGLVLAIVGAAMKASTPMTTPVPTPTQPFVAGSYRSCPRCLAANTWEDRFCTNCGSPLG